MEAQISRRQSVPEFPEPATGRTAKSTGSQPQLANRANPYGLGTFALGEGSGPRRAEPITVFTCDLPAGNSALRSHQPIDLTLLLASLSMAGASLVTRLEWRIRAYLSDAMQLSPRRADRAIHRREHAGLRRQTETRGERRCGWEHHRRHRVNPPRGCCAGPVVLPADTAASASKRFITA